KASPPPTKAEPRKYRYTADPNQVIALIGATVHPVSGPPIENGVVVIRGGRIEGVGAAGQVAIPTNARTINLKGKHVYPGMINPLTTVGMEEINAVRASVDTYEAGDFNPHVRALAGVHPHSVAIPVVRANGITAVMSSLNTGVVQGMGSVIQLTGDTQERMEIERSAALVVDLPVQNPRRRWGGQGEDDARGDWHGGPSGFVPLPPETPNSEGTLEGERMKELIALFERAVLYAKRASTTDDPTAPFEAQARGGSNGLLDAMAPAVSGRIPGLFRDA